MVTTSDEKMPNIHIEGDAEKANTRHEDLTQAEREIYHDDGAILVNLDTAAKGSQVGALKTARDGHTILIPQPSDDPVDPLNWSWGKKHALLMTISVAAFNADFQAGAAAPCIISQAEEWKMTPDHVNYANNLNVLLVGIGGVLGIPVAYFWGRAPLMFWVVLSGTMFSMGCALAPSFNVYYGMKALQGFTLTIGQTTGLAFIHDMFYFHEQARKIGIWTAVFLASPYFGPLFASFILAGTGSWRAVYWLIFAIGCLNLVLMGFFLDETWYRRDISTLEQPLRGNRLLRVVGLWQIRHHKSYFYTIIRSMQRLVLIVLKPVILPLLIYYLMSFMWAVGINQTSAILFATPRAAGGYGFSQKVIGYVFFAPIVAVVIGEVFGHFANDWIAAQYIRKHNGVFLPEARLKPVYLAGAFMVPGLILIGQTLHHYLHWIGIVMGWGMFVFGCLVASVAITAYAVDSYPTAAGEVSSLINLARLLGGFSVGYFQLEWGMSAGFDVSFGVQAAIVAASLLIIVFLHIYGARLRHWSGPLTV